MRQLLRQFLQLESSSGIILFLMAALAIVWANSPLAYLHHTLLNASLFLVNDGLMTIFFLLVGLELKRGFFSGGLSKRGQMILPAGAALGGMLLPALIYVAINFNYAETLKGWSIPVATDIAFALGVLSLFGSRVPQSLKLFLLALAIFDDIGAIVIIAVYYTHELSYFWLVAALIVLFVLYLLNVFYVRLLSLYLMLGMVLWFCLLHSGVHPTLAGILLAICINDVAERGETSTLQSLEKRLHPWVAYLIMPLFALLK